MCLHVLAVFAGKASAYKTAAWKPLGHPAVTHYTTRLVKQTIKLSCLTTRLSPLYPHCLLNHTASVTHPRISAQMCSRFTRAGIIPEKLRSSSLEDEVRWQNTRTQTLPDDTSCFKLGLYLRTSGRKGKSAGHLKFSGGFKSLFKAERSDCHFDPTRVMTGIHRSDYKVQRGSSNVLQVLLGKSWTELLFDIKKKKKTQAL